MTPLAQDLFAQARELPAAERDAFLQKACGDNAELRLEVQRLLVDAERAALFFGDGATLGARGFGDIAAMDFDATIAATIGPLKGHPVGDARANPSAAVPFIFGKRIAQGGMGAILEAEDCKLGRTIAAKVMLLEQDASEDMRQRFIQEAAVLAKLAHPNIVPVYDLGHDDAGQLYYTMKLVKGRTLQNIIDDLRLERPEALREFTLERLLTIFRKVADALAFAHSKGIIHRDLKPENVMVGEFGEVLLMDWGLAKMTNVECGMSNDGAGSGTCQVPSVDEKGLGKPPSLGTSLTHTMQGAIMGTPKYMSPEQAMGRIDELDARSDIFSLGGILYAILTLRPPVEGKTLEEVLEKVSSASITAPTAFGATASSGTKQAKGAVLEAKQIKPLPHIPVGRVPAALSAVAMKALRLDKARRYQDVAAFSADIEAYQNGFATTAEEAGLGKQLVLLIKRHKGIFTTAAAAWLLITALAVWFVFSLRAKEQRASNAEAVAVKKEAETSKALARSAVSLAEGALREGNGPAMQTALQDVPENQRDSTWRYHFDQSDSSFATLDFGGGIDDVAAHPRLPHVFAVVDHSGKVTMLNVRTGERLLEFKVAVRVSDSRFYRMALSADGERIAIGAGLEESGIAVHDGRDGTKLFGSESDNTSALALSSDGRLLLQGGQATHDKPTHLTLRDATSGEILWTVRAHNQPRSLSFLADDRQILMQVHNSQPTILSIADGSLLRMLATEKAGTAALSPDGRSVVTLSDEGIVRGVDLEGNGGGFELSAGDQYGRSEWNWLKVAFSGSGDRFVTVIPLGDGRQAIRVWDAKTRAPRQVLLGGMGRVLGAAIHPLSGELIVCGPQTRAWSLDGARWTFRDQGRRPSSVAFWGSDELILTSANDVAEMALYSLEGESPSAIWKSHGGGNPRVVGVSADGQVAAVGGQSVKPVRLLRLEGREVREVGGFEHPYQLDMIRLSPNGDRAAILQAKAMNIQLYNTATGERPVQLDRTNLKRFFDLAWLDGRHLLGLAVVHADRGSVGAEEQIVVWDTTTGKILRRAANPSAMDVLAVAPDGRRFAEAGADKKVRIRDAATLTVLKEFRAHDGPITALEWHPKQTILATGSEDLTVRLWNLETGERLEELRGPLATPNGLDFSPGGRRLACAALDGTTRIWEPSSLRDETAAPLIAGAKAIDEHVWFKDPLSYRAAAAPEPEKPKPVLPKDADGWEDLLAPLTPAEVEKTGKGWSLKDGELFSPNRTWATLPLPAEVSGSSYQLHMKLGQLAGKDCFHIVLPVADRMCGFDLDGFPRDGFCTGLIQVKGMAGKNLVGIVKGKQVNDTQRHDLEVTVRLDGPNATITATLDGKPLYEWTGPTAALSQYQGWAAATTKAGALALGTMASGWAVSEVKLKRLEAADSVPDTKTVTPSAPEPVKPKP